MLGRRMEPATLRASALACQPNARVSSLLFRRRPMRLVQWARSARRRGDSRFPIALLPLVLMACSKSESAGRDTSAPAMAPAPAPVATDTGMKMDSSTKMTADTTARPTSGRGGTAPPKKGRAPRTPMDTGRAVPTQPNPTPMPSGIDASGRAAVEAWRNSPLGQAMIVAKDSLLPVFTATEVTVTVAQDSVHPMAATAPPHAGVAATKVGDPSVRIGSRVRVQLIAKGCLVDTLGPSEQLVVPDAPAHWRFRVTPQQHGDLPITAQVTDIFEGSSTKAPPFAVPVADLTVHVTSRPIAEVWHVVDEHRAELLPLFGSGGVGAVLLGWLIGRRGASGGRRRRQLRRNRSVVTADAVALFGSRSNLRQRFRPKHRPPSMSAFLKQSVTSPTRQRTHHDLRRSRLDRRRW